MILNKLNGTENNKKVITADKDTGCRRSQAFVTAAAAAVTLCAVLLSYAVLSFCAALVTEQAGGSRNMVYSAPTGVLSDSCGDGYVAAMSVAGLASEPRIGDAVFTSGTPAQEEEKIPALPELAASAKEYFPALSVSAECAALLCADTGELLYVKNADNRHPMASTTKIMTALVALENSGLNDTVHVSPDAVGVSGASVYLYADEELTMETLLYALMLESANDAAAAIAIAVAGDVESFAGMMNERAASLGLENTHYENPHGLDSAEHYTTARELAALTAEALKNETFCELVSTYKKTIEMHNGKGSRLLINHNKLLKSYDGAIGVKTGYTSSSGRCLVTAAERDGLTFIAVTLNAPDDWNDHRAMLDAGFDFYKRVSLAEPASESYDIPVIGGTEETARVLNNTAESAVLRTDADDIRTEVELPRFCFAPVVGGEKLGRVCYYSGDTLIGETALYAEKDIPAVEEKISFHDRIMSFFGR